MIKKYQSASQQITVDAAQFDPESAPHTQSLFTFYSANLLHYLPVCSYSDHLRLFRETYKCQKLSFLDQEYFGPGFPVTIHGWDKEWADQLRSRPGIISTMHAGSYRLINYLLARENIPFALLVSEKVMAEQGAQFQTLFRRLRLLNNKQLEIINAEAPTAPIRMMRLLNQGINLVVYQDGNTGVRLYGKEKLVRIPFLGQHMYVRKGISYIAHKLGLPIYPLVNFRQNDGSVRVFTTKKLEPGNMTAKEFSNWSSAHIWDHFASLLLHYPAQWENWLYIHEHVDVKGLFFQEKQEIISRETLNPSNFGIFNRGSEYFLLDKRQYRIFPIPRL